MTYCWIPPKSGDHLPSTVSPTVAHNWHRPTLPTLPPQQRDLPLHSTDTTSHSTSRMIYHCTPLTLADHSPICNFCNLPQIMMWPYPFWAPANSTLIIVANNHSAPANLPMSECFRIPRLGPPSSVPLVSCINNHSTTLLSTCSSNTVVNISRLLSCILSLRLSLCWWYIILSRGTSQQFCSSQHGVEDTFLSDSLWS